MLWGLVLAACLVRATAPAPAAAAYPYVTTSHYESTTSTSTLYSQGCSAGSAGAVGSIILDFGRPAYRAGAYGTMLFGSGGFASNVSILQGMKAFADGYWNCSPVRTQVIIARGTSNYCPEGSGCSLPTPSFTAAGSYWGGRTDDLATYIANSGYSSQETSAAAVDAEPAWDPDYTSTHDFISGYNSATSWFMSITARSSPGTGRARPSTTWRTRAPISHFRRSTTRAWPRAGRRSSFGRSRTGERRC
jgi:hypothetical protein